MSAFSFADFLIFSGSNVNEDIYVTTAKGVLQYLKTQYGIYPDLDSITETVFLSSGQLSYTPKVGPIVSIDSIVYDSVAITDYTYYGQDILLITALTDVRKPLTVTYSVGYASVPDDLILAIYRHILAVTTAIDKGTDTIEKTVNSAGNTTFYINEVVPIASKHTYLFYTNRTLISF